MNTDCWLLITSDGWGGAFRAARALPGRVTAVVLGPRRLAEQVATAGPDEVRWTDPGSVPVEAYGPALAEAAAADAPGVVVSSADPAARVLLGAIAGRLHTRLVPAVVAVEVADDRVLVRRAAVGGETIETLASTAAVAAIYGGDDDLPPVGTDAPVTSVDLVPAPLSVVASEPVAVASGLSDAERVVSFGRGVKARDDVALVQGLADALGAELACSMPIADDLGWLDTSRYVGRSGNHISPALYLAVGIGGAPQHLEGVRGARVVAAVNNDPEARIFRTADYGIVGDLYDVVPELTRAVRNLPSKELEQ